MRMYMAAKARKYLHADLDCEYTDLFVNALT
jgi:hypothetical protein